MSELNPVPSTAPAASPVENIAAPPGHVAPPTEHVAPPHEERALIRHGKLENDIWRRCVSNESTSLPPDDGHWLVPLELWLGSAKELRARVHPVGVLLAPDDDPAELLEGEAQIDPQGLALIAIDFPHYTDGRGFSIAQLLRTRLGWQGELRAVGDVIVDVIHYLARCGFDSFSIKPGHDPHLALAAFEAFSVHYQRTYPKPALVV